jgi:hypothetical protein
VRHEKLSQFLERARKFSMHVDTANRGSEKQNLPDELRDEES